MSGFLLDTNVISEVAKEKKINSRVREWFAAADEETLYVSVITLGEIRAGVEKVSDAAKKARLEAFLLQLRQRFLGRILSFDDPAAERWGHIKGTLPPNIKLPVMDSMIGAIAAEHNLTVVARNVLDFRFMPIVVVNPFV